MNIDGPFHTYPDIWLCYSVICVQFYKYFLNRSISLMYKNLIGTTLLGQSEPGIMATKEYSTVQHF